MSLVNNNRGGAERIVVIGAGVMGISCAVHLQRRGYDVCVIDKLAPGQGTSFGNAGVLAACSFVPVTVPGLIFKVPKMLLDPDGPLFMKWKYLPRLLPFLVPYLRQGQEHKARRIAAALAEITGDAVAEHRTLSRGTNAEQWLTDTSYLFAYRDRKAYERDDFVWELRRQHWPHGWDELEGNTLREFSPHLSDRYNFGVKVGHHGLCLSPGRYTAALAEHFVREGGELLRAECTSVSADNLNGVSVIAGGQAVCGDRLVIAAGAYSARVAAMLGVTFPLEAERGYHIELTDPSRNVTCPTQVTDSKFVVSPQKGGLRVAGLVEFGGLDAGASVAPLGMLKRRIAKCLPGLTFGSCTEWLGYRPATIDSLPVIGLRTGQPRVAYAFGHHHIGLTGAPRTGRLLAALISGDTPAIDMAPFSPDRFA